MNFQDMEKYQNEREYPERPEKPVLPKNHTSKDALQYGILLKQYETKMEQWRKEKQKYDNHTAELNKLFRRDALEDVGLTGHPKASKAFYMAYEEGHSSGNYEIYQQLCKLADLLLD